VRYREKKKVEAPFLEKHGASTDDLIKNR